MVEGTPPPPKDIQWLLPRHSRSVGRSRELLRDQARAWKIPDDVAETAVLLLSELMTNARKHARVSPGREISARCVLGDELLRIEVSDASDEPPRPRDASPDDESGRGLVLLAALADEWGAHPRTRGIGKTVWFALKLPPGAG
ncbi:ATP-binding protein [Streptomyces sp. 7N604]|uniref:ATP-binding protein n=1 Tax=Streptomyces sp. 7N604 TaxID=3457415 RepID=UPI003FD64C3C